MLVAVKAPNGGIVHVREEAVKQMLDAGFARVAETQKKPTTRKRTTKAKE